MSSAIPRPLLEVEYANAARDYLRSLPPSHFMEARSQATQREITVAGFALLKAQRPDVQYFSEMLVQYPLARRRTIRQVVPDNMVVRSETPIEVEGSFDIPLQPVGPFWVLEYVSKSSKRKDYNDSFQKYERELKVPYYLVFYPDTQDLTLFRRGSKKYVSVKPNAAGRLAIPELDLEMALLDGWVRYWYRGQLLPLPAQLQRDLEAARQETKQAQEQTRQAREQVRQAQEQVKQVQDQAEQERQQKERLLAQLRALGVEPDL